jgi:formate dehydrogenase subunit gamma
MTSKSERIGEIIAEHHRREGALLPILHDVQAEFGCVDEDAEVLIAKGLNLSRADVHGVVSFYHDFSAKPDPRPVVQVCRAAASAPATSASTPRALQASARQTCTTGRGSGLALKSW